MIYVILIIISIIISLILNQNKKEIKKLAINNTILSDEIKKLKGKNYL